MEEVGTGDSHGGNVWKFILLISIFLGKKKQKKENGKEVVGCLRREEELFKSQETGTVNQRSQ